MSDLSLLYLMIPPDNGVDVKVGITEFKNADSRFGNYQNSTGPRFLTKWVRCWIGDSKEIGRLEAVIKRHYKNFIVNEGRGHTEWISTKWWNEVEAEVNDSIEGYRFKVKAIEEEFLPLSMENLDSFKKHVLNSIGLTKET